MEHRPIRDLTANAPDNVPMTLCSICYRVADDALMCSIARTNSARIIGV